eukprot:TRINITY_DN9151_c0_g1_i6.p1 TRINITY_DN9151_c0_g1~~TRINITY_DN9151_c0_g1_i6.p1  ORF type:complete len:116 (+),score=51.15 TRINITY_DN9151_c0_g1_i6:126-473(+)
MIRRPPRSTLSSSSAASDVYKRQINAEYGIVMVNAGDVSGFASASKPATAEDDGAPVGAIVGGIFGAIAGVLLIAAIAAFIYWKYFMTKGGDTKVVDEEVNTTNNSPDEMTTAEA